MADDNKERPSLSLSGDANAAARRSDPPRRPSSKPASHERATRAEMDNVHRLIRDNQRERALDYIDELLERYPEDKFLYSNAAKTCIHIAKTLEPEDRVEMYENAVRYAMSGLQLNKADALLHSLCGSAYRHLHMFEEADLMYERAFFINPDDSRTLYGMAKNCIAWANNHQEDTPHTVEELKQTAADILVSANSFSPHDERILELMRTLDEDGFFGNKDGYICEDLALTLIEAGGFPLQEESVEHSERVASVSPNNGGNGPS